MASEMGDWKRRFTTGENAALSRHRQGCRAAERGLDLHHYIAVALAGQPARRLAGELSQTGGEEVLAIAFLCSPILRRGQRRRDRPQRQNERERLIEERNRAKARVP